MEQNFYTGIGLFLSAASRGRLASWCQWVRVFSHSATLRIREGTRVHRKRLSAWRERESKKKRQRLVTVTAEYVKDSLMNTCS